MVQGKDGGHEAAWELEEGRLLRALTLEGEQVGEGRYRIFGGAHTHWVNLYAAPPHCDCGDHIWRDVACKHILAAMLREGNERVLHAVGSLVTALQKQAA